MFFIWVWKILVDQACLGRFAPKLHDNNNPIVDLPFSGELIDRIDYFIDL
jgi:hypothetical protein